MIGITSKGSFGKTEAFLNKMAKGDLFELLGHYGAMGVNALASATPVESGLTASSWTYEIVKKKGRVQIIWHNTNVNDGIPIAILIQYGHGTGTGGWVQGYDYINPAIQPIFDQIANEVWRQVTNG